MTLIPLIEYNWIFIDFINLHILNQSHDFIMIKLTEYKMPAKYFFQELIIRFHKCIINNRYYILLTDIIATINISPTSSCFTAINTLFVTIAITYTIINTVIIIICFRITDRWCSRWQLNDLLACHILHSSILAPHLYYYLWCRC